MSDQIFTVNSLTYGLTIRKSWDAKLVERNERRLVLHGEFSKDIDHPDLGLIAKGTRSIEYFFPDRWYNFFCFQDDKGLLKSIYFNICMPPKFTDSRVDYVDLDLDILISPDGAFKVLDEDEFKTNSAELNYPAEIIDKALETLNYLEMKIANTASVTELVENLK